MMPLDIDGLLGWESFWNPESGFFDSDIDSGVRDAAQG
jgi:hypothetical protein